MKKLIKYGCILLCLSLLLSACNSEKTENDPMDVGVQAAIALMEGDVDAFWDLLVPNMFSNAGAAKEYEYRVAINGISDWIIDNCEVHLSSAKLYAADKDDNDGFLSWAEYNVANASSYSSFAGSFFYDYAWETLSHFEYSGKITAIAVCEIYMEDNNDPDPMAVILGKVNKQWYVITLLDG